jgi:hypothetical protein
VLCCSGSEGKDDPIEWTSSHVFPPSLAENSAPLRLTGEASTSEVSSVRIEAAEGGYPRVFC